MRRTTARKRRHKPQAPPAPPRDALRPIYDALVASGWPQRIDETLAARPGPTNPVSTLLLLFAMTAGTVYGGMQTTKIYDEVIPRLSDAWKHHFGLTDHPTTPGRWRLTDRFSLRQLRYKLATIIDVIEHVEGGFDAFIADVLHESIPPRRRGSRYITLDGTYQDAFIAPRHGNATNPDPRIQRHGLGWYIRDDREPKGPGYLLMSAYSFDPTDDDPTPLAVGFTINAANHSEPSAAIDVLDQIARHQPVLDLVVADRGIGPVRSFQHAVHARHGAVICVPRKEHFRQVATHRSGALLYLGRVLLPATHHHLHDEFPAHPPKYRSPDDPNPDDGDGCYQDHLDRFHAAFDRLNAITADTHTPLDVNGRQRVKLTSNDPTVRLSLHAHPDSPATATITTADFGNKILPTPFPYGTPAATFIYTAARSRTEGLMGDGRNNGSLKACADGFRMLGQGITRLVVLVNMLRRNLVLTGQLQPLSGRPARTRTSHRSQTLTDDTRTHMMRVLRRRATERDRLHTALTAATVDSGRAPP